MGRKYTKRLSKRLSKRRKYTKRLSKRRKNTKRLSKRRKNKVSKRRNNHKRLKKKYTNKNRLFKGGDWSDTDDGEYLSVGMTECMLAWAGGDEGRREEVVKIFVELASQVDLTLKDTDYDKDIRNLSIAIKGRLNKLDTYETRSYLNQGLRKMVEILNKNKR